MSTAVDQLKLAEVVMKNDAFRAVVATENVKIDGLPTTLYNNNSLLTTMPGVVRGIKTGSSTPAGGAFMWAAYRTVGGKDQLLLGVMMDQRTNSPDSNAHLALVLENSAKVITATRDALVSAKVVKKGQVVGYVDDGLGGRTPVVATKDLSAVGWPGMKATFSMSDGGKAVPHTAKAGTRGRRAHGRQRRERAEGAGGAPEGPDRADVRVEADADRVSGPGGCGPGPARLAARSPPVAAAIRTRSRALTPVSGRSAAVPARAGACPGAGAAALQASICGSRRSCRTWRHAGPTVPAAPQQCVPYVTGDRHRRSASAEDVRVLRRPPLAHGRRGARWC